MDKTDINLKRLYELRDKAEKDGDKELVIAFDYIFDTVRKGAKAITLLEETRDMCKKQNEDINDLIKISQAKQTQLEKAITLINKQEQMLNTAMKMVDCYEQMLSDKKIKKEKKPKVKKEKNNACKNK